MPGRAYARSKLALMMSAAAIGTTIWSNALSGTDKPTSCNFSVKDTRAEAGCLSAGMIRDQWDLFHMCS